MCRQCMLRISFDHGHCINMHSCTLRARMHDNFTSHVRQHGCISIQKNRPDIDSHLAFYFELNHNDVKKMLKIDHAVINSMIDL